VGELTASRSWLGSHAFGHRRSRWRPTARSPARRDASHAGRRPAPWRSRDGPLRLAPAVCCPPRFRWPGLSGWLCYNVFWICNSTDRQEGYFHGKTCGLTRRLQPQ
jgi:hypothetical protein